MRVFATTLVCAFFLLATRNDTIASTKCYTGDDDHAVINPDSFTYFPTALTKRPEVFHDYPAWTMHLKWLPQEDGIVASDPEEIGHCHGRAIYRFIYRATKEKGPSAPLGCTWTLYAYEQATLKDNNRLLTPFFLFIGDHLDSSFESDRVHPFMLRITEGPFTRAEARYGEFQAYYFVFTPHSVHLAKREKGWRGSTETFRYDTRAE